MQIKLSAGKKRSHALKIKYTTAIATIGFFTDKMQRMYNRYQLDELAEKNKMHNALYHFTTTLLKSM